MFFTKIKLCWLADKHLFYTFLIEFCLSYFNMHRKAQVHTMFGSKLNII